MVEIALQKARCVCYLYVSTGGLVSCPRSLLLNVFSVLTFLDNPYLGVFL